MTFEQNSEVFLMLFGIFFPFRNNQLHTNSSWKTQAFILVKRGRNKA